MAQGLVFEGLAQFKQAIDSWTREQDDSTRQAVYDGLAAMQRQAMQNSSGRPGPNVVSGSHRRSFRIEGPARMDAGKWVGQMGPTMVYSRRLELGGGNWPPGLRFPYFEVGVAQAVREVIPGIFRRRWAEARPR